MTRTARGEAGYDATPAGTGPSPADGAAKSADGVTKSADPGTPSADAATLPPDAGAPPAGVEPPSPGVAAGAAGGDAPPPDELPPEPPPMTAGERLRTARMLVVGAVVMWVVLVAAWAGNRALETWASAERNRRAEAARARLADGAELSGVFNEVNAVVEPSVVKIDVLRPTPAPPRPVPGRPEPLPPANSGSGVIVDVDDGAGLTGGLRTPVGYVVTNEHVVRNASAIFVTLFDGRRITARVVGTDPPTDLAVLRVEATGLLPARWGDSDGLRKGDAVLAFGSPFGFVGSMTSGIVSALNRTSDDGVGAPPPAAAGSDAPTPYRDFIQVDAAVNPGNSGGPLADVRGRIVGINTSIFTRTGDFSGIGFAIPSNQARRVYADLRDRGRVVRGYLGIAPVAASARPDLARPLGFDPRERPGVIVVEVYQDSPAAEAGLRRGDVITAIGGEPVATVEDVRNRAAFARPGDVLELDLFRGGEDQSLSVVVGEQPDGQIDLRPALLGDAEGFGLRLTDGPSGVEVAAVRPGSPADRAGLRAGDVLLEIAGRPVRDADSARAALASATPRLGVEVRVESGGRSFVVALREE